MKIKTLLILCFSCVILSLGADTNFRTNQVYPERGPLLLSDTHIYDHLAGVNIKIVEYTDHSLTLECVRNSNIFFYPAPAGANDIPWREFYVIKDGKLLLDHIQEPKVTPAVNTPCIIDFGDGHTIQTIPAPEKTLPI